MTLSLKDEAGDVLSAVANETQFGVVQNPPRTSHHFWPLFALTRLAPCVAGARICFGLTPPRMDRSRRSGVANWAFYKLAADVIAFDRRRGLARRTRFACASLTRLVA